MTAQGKPQFAAASEEQEPTQRKEGDVPCQSEPTNQVATTSTAGNAAPVVQPDSVAAQEGMGKREAQRKDLRCFIREAIEAEPEMPGPMPTVMKRIIVNACASNDWEAVEELFRMSVQQAKANISKRIENTFAILERSAATKTGEAW